MCFNHSERLLKRTHVSMERPSYQRNVKTSSSFLGLPVEIRVSIYRYITGLQAAQPDVTESDVVTRSLTWRGLYIFLYTYRVDIEPQPYDKTLERLSKKWLRRPLDIYDASSFATACGMYPFAAFLFTRKLRKELKFHKILHAVTLTNCNISTDKNVVHAVCRVMAPLGLETDKEALRCYVDIVIKWFNYMMNPYMARLMQQNGQGIQGVQISIIWDTSALLLSEEHVKYIPRSKNKKSSFKCLTTFDRYKCCLIDYTVETICGNPLRENPLRELIPTLCIEFPAIDRKYIREVTYQELSDHDDDYEESYDEEESGEDRPRLTEKDLPIQLQRVPGVLPIDDLEYNYEVWRDWMNEKIAAHNAKIAANSTQTA